MASLLGAHYDSSDDDATAPASKPTNSTPATTVVAAPDVSVEDPMRQQLALTKPTDTALSYNITYDDLTRPTEGPANPFKNPNGNALKRKNIITGYAEEAAVSESTFNTQHRTFQSLGYTRGADGEILGDLTRADQFGGRDVVQMRHLDKEQSEALRRKRQRKGDPSIVDGPGAYKGPWAKYRDDDIALEEEAAQAGEGLASDEEYEEDAIATIDNTPLPKLATDYADEGADGNGAGTESTEFHGSQQFDYQGRTYMHVPQDLDVDLRKEPGSWRSYVPKKHVHTWKSHTKPITALRFFPSSGHLLLSSSADTKIKIWDVYHERELLRTYSGHNKAVTDITFNPDGTRFLSASYDRQMKLWDTEYGKCIGRFSTGKIPHVIKFNPSVDHSHEFVAGMSDKKIIQFDTRSGEMVQEYDHHLGPVNTITFVDEDRRFITTSDDKSLRAWEYNIPVPIKFIAEPYMYSMVRAAPHPSGKYVAFQSGDNQIVVYASTDRFRQNRKKSYRGHNTAGYAVDVAISPDGQFVSSGDTGGFVCFWDWKTCKMYHKIKASDGPVVATQWHPQETSKVVTGALDGLIKYWD
ncbi:putative mRNA splicing factor [Xylona heveae TC161]|uniref:Putative mRNA splicing factor n=1 Tax=Xylona heveae (strain CBS 132557 / TC161) TaxID=1328760 RepID=A0A165JH31_XYLHT|nr:putative mRNA splicing factor [Xylona heveae TC161]KZF26231.1 putative mRNA splicing factor [Xylona heveae TC161]